MNTKYYSLKKRADDEKAFIVSGCFLDESTLDGKVVLTISLDDARIKLQMAQNRYTQSQSASYCFQLEHWAAIVSAIERHEANFGYEFEKYQLIVSEWRNDGTGYKNSWVLLVTHPGSGQYPHAETWAERPLRYQSRSTEIIVRHEAVTRSLKRQSWDDNLQAGLFSHINLSTGEEEIEKFKSLAREKGRSDES